MPRFDFTFPIRLKLDIGAHTRTDLLEDALGAALGRAMANARRIMDEQGLTGKPIVVHAPTFAWYGAGLARVTQKEKDAIAAVTRRVADEQLAANGLPAVAQSAPPRRATRADKPWRIVKDAYPRVRVGDFLRYVAEVDLASDRPRGTGVEIAHEVRFLDFLDDVRQVKAWIVEVGQPQDFPDFERAVLARMRRGVGENEAFVYTWAIHDVWRDALVRVETEGSKAAALPPLPPWRRGPTYIDLGDRVRPGERFLFAMMTLPRLELDVIAKPVGTRTLSVAPREVDSWIYPPAFEASVGFSWDIYRDELPDAAVLLSLTAFELERTVSWPTLHALLEAAVRPKDTETSRAVGARPLVLSEHKIQRAVPAPLREAARALSDEETLVLDKTPEPKVPAGLRVGFFYAAFDLGESNRDVLEHRRPARKLAAELIEALRGFYDHDRDFSFGWLDTHFGNPDKAIDSKHARLFEHLLRELDTRGGHWIERLYRLFVNLPASGWRRRTIELASMGAYRNDPRIQEASRLFNEARRRSLFHRYDAKRQRIALSLPLGRGLTAKVGDILADLEDFWRIDTPKEHLRPERLEEVKSAVRAVGDELVRDLLTGRDTKEYTEDELSEVILERAVKRAGLKPSDFLVKQISLRIDKVESILEAGIERFYITWTPLERFEDEGKGAWRPVVHPETNVPLGVVVQSDYEFEETLRAMRQVFSGLGMEALAKALVVLGGVIAIVGTGAGSFLVRIAGGAKVVKASIALRFIYNLIFGPGLKFESLTDAVFFGYLDALGFRVPVLGLDKLDKLTGNRMRQLLGNRIARWLLVGSTGGASAAVLETFGQDLVRVITEGGSFSSLDTYLRNAGLGAVLGIVGEFVGDVVVAPIFKTVGPTVLHKVGDVLALVAELRKQRIYVTAVRLAKASADALAKLAERLRTLLKEAEAEQIIAAFKARVDEFVENYRRALNVTDMRWRVFGVKESGLSADAQRGLDRLLMADLDDDAIGRLADDLARKPEFAEKYLETIGRLTRATPLTAVERELAIRLATETTAEHVAIDLAAKRVGMLPDAAKAVLEIAQRHQVVIVFRETSKHASALRAAGHPAKPEWLKPKTVNDIDLHLGWRQEDLGLVGLKEPTLPKDLDAIRARDPKLAERIDARYRDRLEEIRPRAGESEAEYVQAVRRGEARGTVAWDRERGIVIDAASGKAFTADYDLFTIAKPGERKQITDQALVDDVMKDLRKHPVAAQHPWVLEWPTKSSEEAAQKAKLVERHRKGGERLVSFEPDGKVTETWSEEWEP